MGTMIIVFLALFIIGACFRIDQNVMNSIMTYLFYFGVIIWAVTMPKKLINRFKNGDYVKCFLYTFIFVFATLHFFGILH